MGKIFFSVFFLLINFMSESGLMVQVSPKELFLSFKFPFSTMLCQKYARELYSCSELRKRNLLVFSKVCRYMILCAESKGWLSEGKIWPFISDLSSCNDDL